MDQSRPLPRGGVQFAKVRKEHECIGKAQKRLKTGCVGSCGGDKSRGAFHTHAIMRLGAQIPYKEEMGTILYDK